MSPPSACVLLHMDFHQDVDRIALASSYPLIIRHLQVHAFDSCRGHLTKIIFILYQSTPRQTWLQWQARQKRAIRIAYNIAVRNIYICRLEPLQHLIHVYKLIFLNKFENSFSRLGCVFVFENLLASIRETVSLEKNNQIQNNVIYLLTVLLVT